MPKSRTLHFALVTSATVLVLGGCSGAGQQSTVIPGQTQSQQSAARQDVPAAAFAASLALRIPKQPADLVIGAGQDGKKAAGGLYVSQLEEHFVNEYALPDSTNSPPACTDHLPIGAVGIAVSARHTLYVPVQHFIGGYETFPIDTFGPNCGSKGHTLFEKFGYPTDVAIDNKHGRVYVTWYHGNGGGIIVYDKGAIYPTRLLSNSAIIGSSGVAVDSLGNVFLAGGSSQGVVEFLGGRQKGSIVLRGLETTSPTGLEMDHDNNLVAADPGNGSIDVFAPPYNGRPTLTISTKGETFYVKLDAANRNLYASDYANGSVDVYAYPSGTYEYSITNGLMQTEYVYGLAVDPPST